MKRRIDATKMPIYTLDIETDPFAYGEMVTPFTCGLWDGKRFCSTWGDNSVEQMHEIVMSLPRGVIYMHNGGGFDFFWLKSWFFGETMIRNSRVMKTQVRCNDSDPHEMRDSYALMPFALKKYKKDDIDYNKMKKDVRELHKEEILKYLKSDCVYLHELVTAFLARFGDNLTIGATAMSEIKKLHKFEVFSKEQDADIRSSYYYGGRVQCFKKGVFKGHYRLYDVNSMYPYVMHAYQHPIGLPIGDTKTITEDTCFITAEGSNYGAFPYYDKEQGKLTFDRDYGIFSVSIHEWNVGVNRGLFKPTRILRCVNFQDRGTFSDFVLKFYSERQQAKITGDELVDLFLKYVLNSGYGKFGQNPENYYEQIFCEMNENPNGLEIGCNDCRNETCARHWMLDTVIPDHGVSIWKRRNVSGKYYNVATGASITGAARAVLLDCISRASNPLYCDTDSLLCESVDGIAEDSSRLGAWKLEKEADTVAIAGRKLYAIFNGGKAIKKATKGVEVPADIIHDLAAGKIDYYDYYRDAPTLKLDGSYNFLHRRVRMV